MKITKALPADAEKFVAAVKMAIANAKSVENIQANKPFQEDDEIVNKLSKLA